MTPSAFPITALLPEIVASLTAHPRLVLEAPPGAGKTTQIPLALLATDWLAGKTLVMLEPRRVAARAAARFMAKQLNEAVGETVGYRIRFESKVSPRTRIEVVTEGILTRMLQNDPTLEGVGALVFDEFHERHLAADLGLALALDVQASLRPDLRLIVMSATLDGEHLARFLDAPRLSSQGRSFPVAIAHFPARRDERLLSQVRRAIEHAIAAHPGDVLVFLPGRREIALGINALKQSAACNGILILPLHGELPVDQQSQILQPDPQGRRRIVLATNVAESSVTLPGVRVVIDSGLAREPRYDPNSGFSRLDIVAVSQASADQRAGRAGRIDAGWTYRLWPASQRLEPQRSAEIAHVELADFALELAAWGSDALRFLDAAPMGALAAARALLQRLGAIDAEAVMTPQGRRMLALGAHPRIAAMLLAPGHDIEPALACDLAALVDARDPLRSRSDAVSERWQALAAFRAGTISPDADRNLFAAIDSAAKLWRHRLNITTRPPTHAPAHVLGGLLLHAFPDRIARQHKRDPHRYQLANGRTARLLDDSALYGEPWIVASELRFEKTGDALILRGAPLRESQLQATFPQRFIEEDTVRWDGARRALIAQREKRYDRIVLDARPAGRVDAVRAAQALTDAVAVLGLQILPWTQALAQWRTRVRCLRIWMPDLALPDLSDEMLIATRNDWLRPAFAGATRLDALTSDATNEALRSCIDWPTRQRIEQLAPTRLLVPSGMERAIEYGFDDATDAPRIPVLAVKLQELFGLADTPRIAEGRVPLLIHLLSPAGRPLQVTQDLEGFWQRTYPEVKKEMKGRYPKHPWPDDPWNAPPTHRAKARKL